MLTGLLCCRPYSEPPGCTAARRSQIQDSSATSRSISGKGNGAYDYQVRACNVGGCGAYSTIQGVTVLLPPGSAPTLTAPSSTTVDNYTVSWTTVATASSYELQERFNGGSWSTIQNTSSTSRAISGKPNGTYGYQVRACNSSGCGSYSAISNVVVSVPQPPATAPSLSGPGLIFEGQPYVGPGAKKRFPAESPEVRAGKEGVPCRYCGKPTTNEPGKPNSRERDHIDPKSRGGNNSKENEGGSCRSCNRSKGKQNPDEWKPSEPPPLPREKPPGKP